MPSEAPIPVTEDMIDLWADRPIKENSKEKCPVALHLKQILLPVEGKGAVVFPPTYADIGYNIDTLSDGTKVVTIDSVGAQANRMEPLFKMPPLAELVPQVTIQVGNEKSVSLFDIGHRLGDALVRCSDLNTDVRAAFEAFKERGDAHLIAKLAPTTLVFGAWDSRGEGAKLPRIVQSTIRAWNVEVLHRAAQYNPPVDYAALEVFDKETKAKAEGNMKSLPAQQGFVHVPAIWRDDAKQEKQLGGIVANGEIRRDVTVNLVALRALGRDDGVALRRYILGLALSAAIEPQDGFLRQGCLLTLDPDASVDWVAIYRDGRREAVRFDVDIVLRYAGKRAEQFGKGKNRPATFRKELAVRDLENKKDKVKAKKGGKAPPDPVAVN